MNTDEKARCIARLNDQFRRTLTGGKVVMTSGVQALGRERLPEVLTAVRCFDQFDQDNDPYNEHDFGRIEIDGHELFWKIDYYDLTLTFHSPDAMDRSQTVRVLTVMLAEEY